MTSIARQPATPLGMACAGSAAVGIAAGLIYTLIAPGFWTGGEVAERGPLIALFGVVFQLFELVIAYLFISICMTLLVRAQLLLVSWVMTGLHRRFADRLPYYVATGAICSLAAFLGLILIQAAGHVMPEGWRYWHQLVTVAAVGQAAALIFWMTRSRTA
ncbi:MAG: hypothetical protein ABR970_13345 [Roseiarcus sp.]